ncbi:decaprenyl-phosphate phosphoribosyltransferase [Microbacteriaceae bacterium 4G12]
MNTTKALSTTQEHVGIAETIKLLFLQLRPKQWTKNLLVFAALIFSFKKIETADIVNNIISFFVFSFVSGCVYILNDYIDIEADKLHPEKKNRPMASGRLNPKLALFTGVVLLTGSLSVAYFLHPLFCLIIAIYFILNVLYSLKLKHVVILDIMIIAAGFVFRALGGGLVINVIFTPWFLLCTMLLALFLAIGKRRHELILLQEKKGSHRKVLEHYSVSMLDQMVGIVTAATIMSYSLFTFSSGHTIQLMWTIPFVIYGIFRYLYLIHILGKGGKPEEVLLQDKGILATVALFGITVITILYFFD